MDVPDGPTAPPGTARRWPPPGPAAGFGPRSVAGAVAFHDAVPVVTLPTDLGRAVGLPVFP